MAEPQDMKAVRNLLDDFTRAIASAGVARSAPLLPGAVVGLAKAIEFVTQHIEYLEGRIQALES
jgi:hypothetical protein